MNTSFFVFLVVPLCIVTTGIYLTMYFGSSALVGIGVVLIYIPAQVHFFQFAVLFNLIKSIGVDIHSEFYPVFHCNTST